MNSNQVTKIVTTKFKNKEGKVYKIGTEMFNNTNQSLYEKEVTTKGKLIKELRTIFTHSNTRIIETRYNTNGDILSKSEYDLNNRMLNVFEYDIKTGIPKITLFKYNERNSISELISDDNVLIMKYLEDSDLLTEVCDEHGVLLTSYYYDIDNHLMKQVDYKNDVIHDYHYNNEKQISSITHLYNKEEHRIHFTEYTYHDNGKEATVKDAILYKDADDKNVSNITFTKYNDKGDRVYTEIIENDKTVFKDSYRIYYNKIDQLHEIKCSNYTKQILYI